MKGEIIRSWNFFFNRRRFLTIARLEFMSDFCRSKNPHELVSNLRESKETLYKCGYPKWAIDAAARSVFGKWLEDPCVSAGMGRLENIKKKKKMKQK